MEFSSVLGSTKSFNTLKVTFVTFFWLPVSRVKSTNIRMKKYTTNIVYLIWFIYFAYSRPRLKQQINENKKTHTQKPLPGRILNCKQRLMFHQGPISLRLQILFSWLKFCLCNNLVPRSLVDEAEGEIWPYPICTTWPPVRKVRGEASAHV